MSRICTHSAFCLICQQKWAKPVKTKTGLAHQVPILL